MTTSSFDQGSDLSSSADFERIEPAERAARRKIALDRVLDCFALEARGGSPPDLEGRFTTLTQGPGRLYGGTSFALAYLAAQSTVDDARRLHSISGTFLRAGRSETELECDVLAARDGRSFSNRRGVVRQGSRVLFEGDIGFRIPLKEADPGEPRPLITRTGISHSVAKPPDDVPAPNDCLDREQERTRKLGLSWLEHPVNAVEVLVTDPKMLTPGVKLPPRAVNWVRVPGSDTLDEHLRIALLLYASDRALLSTAALPHGILWTKNQAVTLNHSVWLHQVPSPGRWHLFVAESRIAVDGLALIHVEMFSKQGELVATGMQEALVQY